MNGVRNMTKVGRNDPCPCGSGKKYKKCCINKQNQVEQKPIKPFFNHLSYEEVDELCTEQIIAQLKDLGVPFERDQFLKDIEEYYSAEDISEDWFSDYQLVIGGRMEDFPWLAATVLWNRLANPNNLSMEKMYQLIEDGYDCLGEGDPVSACDHWLKAWEGIKYRVSPVFQTLDYLEERYRGSFYVSEFCQNLEMELFNASLEDPTYLEIRIQYCQEFCRLFPSEDQNIMFNMRRAIADSYGSLKQFNEAEAAFEQLAKDFSDNLWTFIAWGDYYSEKQDRDIQKAKEKYEKALSIGKATNDADAFVVEERLESLEEYPF